MIVFKVGLTNVANLGSGGNPHHGQSLLAVGDSGWSTNDASLGVTLRLPLVLCRDETPWVSDLGPISTIIHRHR